MGLPSLAATERLAAALAAVARAGDVIALSGPIGAGKTAFARAFIRAATGDPALTVASPTFTLVQVYDQAEPPIWHVDAYRLETEAEAEELGLDDAFASAISLIEWPERIAALLPRDCLWLGFAAVDEAGADAAPDSARQLTWRAGQRWTERWAKIVADAK